MNDYNNNFREIKDLNKLVLDKDYVVKECQDQLGHFLQKDYDNARVSIFRDNLRHIVKSFKLNISLVFSACSSVFSIKEYPISCCLHIFLVYPKTPSQKG